MICAPSDRGGLVPESEGLLVKVLTTGPRVRGYNFRLFLRLNVEARAMRT